MLLLFINVHLIVVHLILLSTFITIVITSRALFLLFLYQLEEHMTYLVCEVELDKKKMVSIVYSSWTTAQI